MSTMNVSIIIPAHNAAATITETLESVRAQTFPDWEAIVVNNGSHDETLAIATRFAEKDRRIRMVNEPQKGVSIARNTGIRSARFDWLLFLDADDWLLPRHLEKMMRVLAADPNLGGVHCGWTYIAPGSDHHPLCVGFCEQEGDLFHLFASGCAFAIHACIILRSVVVSLGCFDTSLVVCEDWDLWQRIARTGVRFGAVHEALACYRMRPGSASKDGFRLFTDGLRLIEQGHSADSRVPNPRPEHAHGLQATQRHSDMFYHMCWCAGILLGHGQDARHLLDAMHNIKHVMINQDAVASSIFLSSLRHACRPIADCDKFLAEIEPYINDFLLALEKKAGVPGLSRRVNNALERLILDNTTASLPLALRTKHAVRFEVTEAVTDILLPASVERLYCKISFEGRNIDTLELPVCDGMVSRYVLADAIASEYGWKILGCFFEKTVYRDLKVKKEQQGLSLWRGDQRLAMNLPDNAPDFWSEAHDQCGWTVFLQEIWGLPDWTKERFYDPQTANEMPIARLSAKNNRVTIEVGHDMPDVEVSGTELHVLATVGGTALAVVTIPVQGNVVHAQELRAAITEACGFELCRVAVRECLIGKPMNGQPKTLRGRLAAAAEAAKNNGNGSFFEKHNFATDHNSASLLDLANRMGGAEADATAAAANILRRILSHGEHAVVFGRRECGRIGTSISRRAMLPAATAQDLIEAAAVAGEPVIQIPEPYTNPSRVVYAPEIIVHSSLQGGESIVDEHASEMEESHGTTVYGQHYFEKVFAQPDPWKYTSPYEQKKYEQQLEMLPPGRIRRALEVACAEGHFTVQLAPRVDNLTAADISPTALDRATKRCAGMKNVQFAHLGLAKDPIPGHFDLIVCSEVLYFVGGKKDLKSVARKLVNALEPWGHLLTAHAHVITDDPDHTGFDWGSGNPFGAKVIGETFENIGNLRLVKELRTPLYRIQLFQRVPRMYSFLYRDTSTPELVVLPQQPTGLLPEVAAYILWEGKPSQGLPILMYHRVAPTGSPETARYRVTPELFEEQLRYLHNAGYYSASIEDWYAAREKNRPLRGKAVMITFDDGYLDFLTYAWPLLKRYGFTATVFIVADLVGRTNTWDSAYGEELPLLGWEEILQLQDEGVVFGSHSVSHPFLTTLSVEEIAREGARSRAILGRKLGKAINTFAYPYGDTDRVVQHCIGACGYIFGLTAENGLSKFHDPLLALPRIEVCGSDKIKDFTEKLDVR